MIETRYVNKMGEACQFVSDYTESSAPVVCSFAGGPKQWYAVKVRSGSEASVVDALETRGFRSYCPIQKERRRYSDRMKLVDTPVFPGYVFCSFDVEKKLPVISCPGVAYVVGFAGRPTSIPDVQIDNVRRMVGAGATASEALLPGSRVRVTHGPLSGVEGTLVREPRGNRLVVTIELLNRAATLYIGEDQTITVL